MAGMKEQMDVIHTQQTTIQTIEKNTDDNTSSSNAAVQSNADTLPLKPQKAPEKQLSRPMIQQPPRSLFDDDFFNQHSNDAQNWNPYEEIQRMQRDMDRMFNNTFSRFNGNPDFQHLFAQRFTTPEMDVQEDDNQYTVIVDLPGASEENISVNLDDQTLTVKGEQEFEKQDKDAMGNIIFQERRSGSFQRSITLPGPVKQSGMKTEVSNGVLTITIPKEV